MDQDDYIKDQLGFMMPHTALTFSRLQDSTVAITALDKLVGDTRRGGDNGDGFEFCFGSTLTADIIARRTYLVATDGPLIIAILVLILDAAVTLPGVAQVSGIITSRAYRRKGIATRLLSMAGLLAAENDKPMLTLLTVASDHAAAFFKQAGFMVNSTEPSFSSMPDGRLVDTVTYWKRYSA